MVVMKNSILFFLLLIPAFLFAQYPNTGNKARLGYQTTGDGLIWRGVAADTVLKPRVIAHAYFQLDTVNGVLRRYIATRGSWQVIGGGSSTDSTVYATRYWTGQNFFPLEGGTLTGTGGAGFIGFPSQVSAPGTPASGLNVYAQGSSFNWKGTDGYERQFGGTLTGGRSYTLPDINGTLALGTGATDRSARWSGTNTVGPGNITDNGTKLEALKPWQFNSSSLAGLPTGVTRYIMDISDYDWFARYSSTAGAWISPIQSSLTAGKGTATRVLFSDANGRATDDAGLRFETTSKTIAINRASIAVSPYHLEIQSNGTINQRWISVYNSSGIQQASYDSDGSGNGAVLVYNNSGVIQGRFSSGDASFLTGKMVFGAQVLGTADFLVALRQTDIGFNTRANIGSSGNGYPGVGYNVQFTSSNNSYTRKSNDQCYFLDLGTSGRLSLKTAAAGSTGSSITWNEDFSLVQSTRFIGIGQTNPQRKLDVNGEVRIADLTTDTPTRFVGADADGDLGAITLNSIWRDYQNDKGILGSDSSFIHDPAVDSTRILGTLAVGKPSTLGSPATSTYPFIFRNPSTASTYMLIESGRTSPTGGTAGIRFLPSGQFGSAIDFGTSTSSNFTFYSNYVGANVFSVGLSNFVTGNKNTTLVGTIQDPIQWDYNGRLVIYDTITSGKALFLAKKIFSSSTPLAMFSSGSNDRFTFDDNGTSRFHTYGQGNKKAADLSKTQSAYIASWATDGTWLDYPLSSLGNGIYGGSGTLSQHTTRARIPDDGNFLISQLYNSDADSAYIHIVNGLDGNREVRLGVTDTMSTGFSTLVLKQDANNEVMSWQLRSSDNEGQTVIEGDGGNISMSVDEGYEVQISGMVRAKREAYSEITSTSSPQTLSSTYSDNLINQGSTQATFTLNMPASPDDGQVCTITFNNAITTLTIDGNGETIVGSAVVTGVPGSQRKFKFYSGIGWIKLY